MLFGMARSLYQILFVIHPLRIYRKFDEDSLCDFFLDLVAKQKP